VERAVPVPRGLVVSEHCRALHSQSALQVRATRARLRQQIPVTVHRTHHGGALQRNDT
jgi:hypothetical protein